MSLLHKSTEHSTFVECDLIEKKYTITLAFQQNVECLRTELLKKVYKIGTVSF